MMGRQEAGQTLLFNAFNLEDHVPANHLLRGIDQLLDLSELHRHLAPHYSHTGRPSVDPALLIRMLIVGYCFGVRSERRLCEEVHLNLAYRWFCRLDLEDTVPDHSTFSKNRHGRFRDNETYSTNYLIDTKAGVIVDVEATPAYRTDEVNATRVMVDRVEERFDIKPMHLIGDTAYGTPEMLGWMVDDQAARAGRAQGWFARPLRLPLGGRSR